MVQDILKFIFFVYVLAECGKIEFLYSIFILLYIFIEEYSTFDFIEEFY